MPGIKGTETEKNLLKAFAGESQARNRYTYFASAARKEGYRQIESLFIETAENEREHAKRFFKFLEGGDLEITATYPAGKIGRPSRTSRPRRLGERGVDQALSRVRRGRQEGGISRGGRRFTTISKVEKEHEARYLKLAQNIEKGTVFKKVGTVRWKCRNCGYVHEGPEAPGTCPACLHPQEYFEIKETTY